MRILAAFGILAILGAPSRAAAEDEDASIGAAPRTSVGVYFTGHNGTVRGVTEGGIGPTLELALGSGRTQYLMEGSIAWLTTGADQPHSSGVMARGAVGVRWIARSFALGHTAALDMTLEAVGGVQRIWWADDAAFTRPELGLGWGWQVRRHRKRHLTLRFGMRVFFAPTGEPAAAMTACRGTCEARTAPLQNGGVMFLIGGAL